MEKRAPPALDADDALSYKDQRINRLHASLRHRKQTKEEQIEKTPQKPQWIVIQRLLSHLQ